jgi:nucleotide-binding universal stress UspA family protein
MYTRILVPLDGSPRAERILPHVEALAQKFGAKLVLVRVVEPIHIGVAPHELGGLYIPEVAEHLVQEAKTYLNSLQSQLRAKQIEAKTVIESGPVVSTLLAVADRENVDLIALASHGRTGLARVFYGSVAAGLLNQTDRPVLLIRAQD